MKPVRELMQDKRVAGGLAALALLFVVYRVTHTGKPSASPGVPDNGVSPASSATGGANETAPGTSAFAAGAVDNAVPASVPKGDVAWNWERNPFVGPSVKGLPPTPGDEFPAIIVPGFGGKGAAPALPPAAGQDEDARPKEPEASVAGDALPELRGTVLSGGRGIAIFGNRLVSSGEPVAGWTVDRVTAYEVTLRKGGERRTIEVFRPENGGKP